MQDILDAFYMTMELWIFLGILAGAIAVEDLIKWYRSRAVDNPTLW